MLFENYNDGHGQNQQGNQQGPFHSRRHSKNARRNVKKKPGVYNLYELRRIAQTVDLI